jgi:glucan 1,3-beta-glucosidase
MSRLTSILRQGNVYTAAGAATFSGAENSSTTNYPRPQGLLTAGGPQGGQFYERSKPSYATTSKQNIVQARAQGAKGDGKTDDTVALNNLLKAAAANTAMFGLNGFVFLDAGYYLVTDTIYVPPNVRIVGEGLATVILGSGPKFSQINNPYPVVQIGKPGETGVVEISDLIVSTQGPTAGAVLIEYNLNSPSGMSSCSSGGHPSALWDVHARIGGFAGSELLVSQCLKTPTPVDPNGSGVKPSCIAAHTSMHITKTAGNLLMENNWLWVADHDIEDATNTQISVFAGRGLFIEGTGLFWLYGTAVEHHTLYQYQLANTQNIFLGQIQTETPYYQPSPPAPYPFTPNATLSDPDFSDCSGNSSLAMSGAGAPCAMAWGLRVLNSSEVVIFGAGLYSFFNNYNTSCSTKQSGEDCQARMFYVGQSSSAAATGAAGAAGGSSSLAVYNLNTVGAVSMVTQQGKDVVQWEQNFATFASTLAMYVFGS